MNEQDVQIIEEMKKKAVELQMWGLAGDLKTARDTMIRSIKKRQTEEIIKNINNSLKDNP